MSQSNDDHIKPWVLDHYRQLCAAHGTAPTTAEIEELRLVVGTHKDSQITNLFEYALLYFLPRSAIVFKEDTLLVGWRCQSRGPKQEIWYRLRDTEAYTSSRLYLQCGAPPSSAHRVKAADPICDEWHPALAAICTPDIRANEHMRYAYFAAVVRLMRPSRTPALVDNPTEGRPRLIVTLKVAVPKVTPSHDITQSSHDGDLGRDRKRSRRAVVVDLTEPDLEEETTSGPAPGILPLDCKQNNTSAEQELRAMVQSNGTEQESQRDPRHAGRALRSAS